MVDGLFPYWQKNHARSSSSAVKLNLKAPSSPPLPSPPLPSPPPPPKEKAKAVKFTSAISKKLKKLNVLSKPYHNYELKSCTANSVDPDEAAHFEPPHLDLYCLQIQLFSFFGPISLNVVNCHNYIFQTLPRGLGPQYRSTEQPC